MINPVETYINAVFHPNKPNNKTSATSFIIGAAIKNENVTPSGTPLSTNPRNKGIAEHEQNGVTIPKKLAEIFPAKSFFPPKIFLVFSGEKYVRTIPTAKTINIKSSRTLGTSKMKKLIAEVR
jgi:hypothetical protein